MFAAPSLMHCMLTSLVQQEKGICAMVSAMCHCPHSLSHKQVCHDQNKTDNLLFSFGYCSRGVASHLPVVVLHS